MKFTFSFLFVLIYINSNFNSLFHAKRTIFYLFIYWKLSNNLDFFYIYLKYICINWLYLKLIYEIYSQIYNLKKIYWNNKSPFKNRKLKLFWRPRRRRRCRKKKRNLFSKKHFFNIFSTFLSKTYLARRWKVEVKSIFDIQKVTCSGQWLWHSW